LTIAERNVYGNVMTTYENLRYWRL